MKCSAYVISCAGSVRENNEDNFFVNGVYRNDYKINDFCFDDEFDLSSVSVVAVFDGMGGINHGEEASGTAAKSLLDYLTAAKKEDMEFNGEMAIRKINNSVCKVSRRLSAHLGSTIVMAVINENYLQIFNIGDSRAYICSKGKLKRLSVDHNEAALYEQMNIRDIIPNAKNVLTQHLGIEEEEFVLEPAISEIITIENDDILLLCSDGLCGLVQDESIADILINNSENMGIKEKSEELVASAVKAGGNDNITVMLIRFEKR